MLGGFTVVFLEGIPVRPRRSQSTHGEKRLLPTGPSTRHMTTHPHTEPRTSTLGPTVSTGSSNRFHKDELLGRLDVPFILKRSVTACPRERLGPSGSRL